jgi:hypothetical protein
MTNWRYKTRIGIITFFEKNNRDLLDQKYFRINISTDQMKILGSTAITQLLNQLFLIVYKPLV